MKKFLNLMVWGFVAYCICDFSGDKWMEQIDLGEYVRVAEGKVEWFVDSLKRLYDSCSTTFDCCKERLVVEAEQSGKPLAIYLFDMCWDKLDFEYVVALFFALTSLCLGRGWWKKRKSNSQLYHDSVVVIDMISEVFASNSVVKCLLTLKKIEEKVNDFTLLYFKRSNNRCARIDNEVECLLDLRKQYNIRYEVVTNGILNSVKTNGDANFVCNKSFILATMEYLQDVKTIMEQIREKLA